MRYEIKLTIEYKYDNPADHSRHIVRLMPADLSGEQRLIAGAMSTRPTPDETINRQDFFGNKSVELAFTQMHQELRFSVQARVERMAITPSLDAAITLPALAVELSEERSLLARSPMHFTSSSSRAPVARETSAYTQAMIVPGMSVIELVAKLGSAICADFKYDPEATTVETPMLEAFAGRHGVCQDFAHVMISCLRGVGIPAGYVSGLLRTKPAEGKPRLEGADAMHAWVMVWCGHALGWIEYDPTNDVFVGQDHIVIARGRDYFDVAPIKGIMRTFGSHRSKQSVDVVPMA